MKRYLNYSELAHELPPETAFAAVSVVGLSTVIRDSILRFALDATSEVHLHLNGVVPRKL